jgi:predicted TIM-barrel fold metal-dependent hydrolase
MIEGAFVFDTISHALNLEQKNILNRYGQGLADLFYHMNQWNPEGYRVPKEYFYRDLSIDEQINTLLLESPVDLIGNMNLQLTGWMKDGLASRQKNLESAQRFPDRYINYIGVDCTKPPQEYLQDLKDLVSEMPRVPAALKLYPSQIYWENGKERFKSWRADNPEVYALYETAAKLGIKTFIFHKALTDGPVPLNPYRVDDIDAPASLYPEFHFQIVHGGMAFMDETAQAIARYPNVSVNMEVTTLLLHKAPEWFADILAHFFWWGGPEKVVWSSGAMFAHPRPLIERFWYEFKFPQHILDKFGLEQITQEQKKLILGENACRIFGIDIESAKQKIEGDQFSRKLKAEGYAAPWSHWLQNATREKVA